MGMFDDLIPADSKKGGGGMFDDLIPEPAPNAGQSRFGEQTNKGQAAAIGLLQGATANFGDELAGVKAAGFGVPDVGPLPLGTIYGLARLGYESLTGRGEGTKKYEAARDAMRETTKAAEIEHPAITTASEIAGAVLTPGVGRALQAATLPARALRAGGVGAVMGGLAGAGEGEALTDRASRAASGAAIGGIAGAAGAPIVEGLARGGSALVSAPVNMLRGAVNPTGAAERAVGRAQMEAVRADPGAVNRLTGQDLTPSGPAVVMDTLGQPGRNLARSAANISGEARDTLNQTLDPRFEEQAPRLAGWLRSTFHYPDAHAQQEALEQTAKSVNDRAYAVARNAGDHQIWSPELERLASAPEVVAAMKNAAATGKSRAVLEGGGGFNPGVTVDNGGIVTFQRGPNGQPTYPNLQFWDYTRRALSNEASKAAKAGDNDGASIAGGLAKQMNAELDKLVPEYQRARSGAASFFGAENALEAGQKFVTENFAIPRTREALARMSDTERQLFQDGFVSRFTETLGKIPDRADVVRRVYNSPEARTKIEIALGPQRARELEAMLRTENIMQQSLRAVQGNSTTAMQIMGAGLAGAGGGGWLGFDPTTSGLASALATAGKKGIDHRVATRIAQLLTSNDPAVLQRGTRMMASNQRLMDTLRAIDNGAARAAGNQSPNIVGPQALGISRAEDQ